MWVESEVSKGSKFFFTITSQISHSSMESTLGKMAAFAKRTILFVDTLFDRTGVVDRIKDLGLRPYVVHVVGEVADKEKCPHIDTIVVDSLTVVSVASQTFSSLFLCLLIYFLHCDRRNAFGSTSTCDIFLSFFSLLRCRDLIVGFSI